MDREGLQKYLHDIYYDPVRGYTGVESIYRRTLSDGKSVSRYRIRKFLQNQDSYSLQRGVRRKFKRSRVIVAGIDDQWEIDLLDVAHTMKFNNGVRFLLMIIDIFSKYLWVVPLKNKLGKTVADAMESILKKGRVPTKIRSDRGGEFTGSFFKKLMLKYNINHFFTNNETKACIIERLNRTFRNVMHRYFTATSSYEYLKVLPKLTENYNSRAHRTLGFIAPSEVNKSNELQLWRLMYLKKSPVTTKKLQPRKPKPKKYVFKIGALVRISHLKWAFQRDYMQKWSTEVFKVSGRYFRDEIPVYKLQDLMGDDVLGTFYNSELQRITDKNNESLWKIEKILRTRKKRGIGIQCLIRWSGFPKKFDSWIDKKEIKET